MFSLILGIVLFFGIHSISIIALEYREKFVAMNEKAYKAVYALVSFLGLYLIVTGYASLRENPNIVYFGVQSLRPLVSILMLFGFILFWAPYFPGKIKAITKNPQLIAVVLWAFSHLLVNGRIADLMLFGSFFVWAVIDLVSMKKRQQRVVTPLKASWVNDVIAIVIGSVVYGLFVKFLHASLIGIPLVS